VRFTEKQYTKLIHPNYTAEHLHAWCRSVVFADEITDKQYQTAMKIVNMSIFEQRKMLIWEDELIPAKKNHKIHKLR